MTNKNEEPVEIVEDNQNLDLWLSVEETDPKYTKPVSFGGRQYTTIDAYYQIKTATEQWGSYGSTWGLKHIEYYRVEESPMMRVSAVFYYPRPQLATDASPEAAFEITSAIKYVTGKGSFDDDFAKKVETDLITKSLSRLGFNSDIFMGKFDDNKYTEVLKEKYSEPLYTLKQKSDYDELIENEDGLNLFIMESELGADVSAALYNSFPKGQKVKMKAIVTRLVSEGRQKYEGILDQLNEYIANNDDAGVLELQESLSQPAKNMLKSRLSNENMHILGEMLVNTTKKL